MYAVAGLGATALTLKQEVSKIYVEVTKAKEITVSAPEQDSSEVAERDEDLRVAEVSAYTSTYSQTDGSPYITADGTNLKEIYECVIASNDYDFGTKLAIEELGVCTVHDRLNSRYDGTGNLDWYAGNDLTRALEFGRRELSYIVIE